MWRIAVRLREYLEDQLWFRPMLASLGSILLSVLALRIGRLYEGPLPIELSDQALKSLLSIFASSMLAVATFSVSTVVTVVSTVSSSTTPRASRLVLADSTTQTVLASFIAAFIYSMIGILALEAYAFDRVGRFVIFVGLTSIVVWVLVAFVSWIDHITKLGRVETAIEKIASTALAAITPDNVTAWGARVYDGATPAASCAARSAEVGYVTHVNVAGLQALADELGVAVYLAVRPGDFVDVRSPIARLTPVSELVREAADRVNDHITVSRTRSHGADVRYGLVVMAETADRALSPGVNDPGTAIAILGRELEVLTRWAELWAACAHREATCARVFVPPLAAAELVRDAFTPIARDGAGLVEVGIRLQKTLAGAVRLDNAGLTRAAAEMSGVALGLAEAALVAEDHKRRVRDAAREVVRLAAARSDAERDHAAAEGVSF